VKELEHSDVKTAEIHTHTFEGNAEAVASVLSAVLTWPLLTTTVIARQNVLRFSRRVDISAWDTAHKQRLTRDKQGNE